MNILLGLAFPPHTRGCTLVQVRIRHPFPVSPAHAGMYRIADRARRSRHSFPRTRGDVPEQPIETTSIPSFPPHTRGCTADRSHRSLLVAVFPAHAGMYPVHAGLGVL